MSADFTLLRQYVENHSEDAFRTLVERHSGMVHGTALRIANDHPLAEEITQAVFILLARKAASLRPAIVLAGWLYRTARFVALEARRRNQRRQHYHQNFAQMNDSTESAQVWEQIAPLLEEAMNRLGATDRNAIVLRFLEERSFVDVAAALGISEAAAKMRVGRALEKLRTIFTRRGVVMTVSVLLAAFAHSTTAAPAGLATSVTSAALSGDGLNTSSLTLVKGTLKLMTWHKIKIAAAAVGLLLLLSGGTFLLQRAVPQSHSPGQIVASFEPLAGEWEGTFELTGDELPRPLLQTAALSIRTAEKGRLCEIEMRVSDRGQPVAVYQFSHALSEAGDRITTLDDPRIARANGDGIVTESVQNDQTGEWRVAFRAPLPNQAGAIECRWRRQGNQLTITRRDQTTRPNGSSQLFSDLRLHRTESTRAQ